MRKHGYVLGVHNGGHDASACLFHGYKLVSAISLERLTRKKNAAVTADAELPLAAIDECLGIAGIGRGDVDTVCFTREQFELQSYKLYGGWRAKQAWARILGRRQLFWMSYMMRKRGTVNAAEVFDADRFRRHYGFRNAGVFFANHHYAHGIAAYFFSEFDDALVYTADGLGDNVSFSARTADAGSINPLFGGDEEWQVPFVHGRSMGLLYVQFTESLGFAALRHEGKVTGLSAFGEPKAAAELLKHYSVDALGKISTDFATHADMKNYVRSVCQKLSREDAAASVQFAVEKIICEAIGNLLHSTGLSNVALGGGLFANVKLNRAILDNTPAKKIFIFPAMGDEGLPVGACLLHLLARDGAATFHANRYKLDNLYLGRAYDTEFDDAASRYPDVVCQRGNHLGDAVAALVRGEIVAIFTSRMEFGPRALGARSILASPARREVNDTINARLQRSEFMPFAPVVLEDRASEVFDISPGNAHAARFMTITCAVRPEWQARIPAVVHVDGSARPQTINATDNPLYFRVLTEFFNRTGLPVLVNTSFNVHEEPIINTPDEALRALVDGRVDRILTTEGLYRCAKH